MSRKSIAPRLVLFVFGTNEKTISLQVGIIWIFCWKGKRKVMKAYRFLGSEATTP